MPVLNLVVTSLLCAASTATAGQDDGGAFVYASGLLGEEDLFLRDASRLAVSEAQHECGQIVAKLTKDELKAELTAAAANIDDVYSLYAGLLLDAFLPSISYGFQSMKVCGSCAHFQDLFNDSQVNGIVEDSFADYCGPDAYGNNATVSGLLVLPFHDSADDPIIGIPPGPMKGALWTHGTQTQTFRRIPSEFVWENESNGILRMALLTAPTLFSGAATIHPDFLGYGESHDFYKSYLVKQAYQTATMPLWFEAKEMIAACTNCRSDLVDVISINGYSEGGYAGIAVAAAMINSGVKVLGTYAGGGPYRLSSTMLTEGVRIFDEGQYPPEARHYLALWGSSYSSTNTDLPNYGVGQDMIGEENRSAIIEWVQQGSSPREMNKLIPNDDPLGVGNPNLTLFLRKAVANNTTYPCVGYNQSLVGSIDKICEAYIENDLTSYLEDNTLRHPIDLCHSPEDKKVFFGNGTPEPDCEPVADYRRGDGQPFGRHLPVHVSIPEFH